jgi:hypothetical protein
MANVTVRQRVGRFCGGQERGRVGVGVETAAKGVREEDDRRGRGQKRTRREREEEEED